MTVDARTYNVRSVLRLARSLRALRRARGWTQVELAARADVSRQWLIAAERGESDRLEIGRLLQVLDALEVTLVVQDDQRDRDSAT